MSSISAPPWRIGKMRASPDLTLWGVGTSRTFRPHWAMYELGLPYKMKPIEPRTGETKTAEYARLNPRQKVPLLQDGDFCIGESAAIVAYLSQTYSTPDRSLIPEAPREYAVWLEWCFLVVAQLDSTNLYVGRRARPNLWDCARGGRKSWRIFSRAVAPRRRRALGWPAVPDRRQIYERRHPAHDLPGLGDRLRRRNLR